MTTEESILLGLFLFLGIILIPCVQGACSKYYNPYGKYRVYKNLNEKYFVKYVDFYAYGIIPVWRTYKTRKDTVSSYRVKEFDTKAEARGIMDKYHKNYIQMKNSTKIKK